MVIGCKGNNFTVVVSSSVFWGRGSGGWGGGGGMLRPTLPLVCIYGLILTEFVVIGRLMIYISSDDQDLYVI